MKINPNDPVFKPLLTGQAGNAGSAADTRFHDVLGKVIGTPDKAEATATDLKLMQSISGIQLQASLAPESEPVIGKVANFLDLLDAYRQMLADPKTTLREMGPVVGRIAGQRDELAKTLESMDSKDGLHDILNQALVTAATEIVKFNKGDYV
jgi:hypothetical protein